MKKIFAKVAVAVAIIVAFASVSFAWLSDNDTVKLPTSFGGSTKAAYFAGGDGSSADDAYKISNAVHMYNLAWLQYIGYFNYNGGETGVNNGLKQSYFELTADIDMSLLGSALPPIGTEEYPFIGNFNGNGHTISGLTVSNTKGDGNITKYPTNARFDANGMLDCADNSSKEVQIVGAFGVVGNYNKVVGYTLNDTLMNVKGFYLDGITVKTYSENTLVGLVAGEVSASLSNVGVGKSQINLSSSSVGLGDNGNVVSKYSIVGDYDAESVGWTTKPTGGSSGWGGSIDMRQINRRLNYIFATGYTDNGIYARANSLIYNTDLGVRSKEWYSGSGDFYWNTGNNNTTASEYTMYIYSAVMPLNINDGNLSTLTEIKGNDGYYSYSNADYLAGNPEVTLSSNTGYIVGYGSSSVGPRDSKIRSRVQPLIAGASRGVYYSFGLSDYTTDTTFVYDKTKFTMYMYDSVTEKKYAIKDDVNTAFSNKMPYSYGYKTSTPEALGLHEYNTVRKKYDEAMEGSLAAHGFHFMQWLSSKNYSVTGNMITKRDVVIAGETKSDYLLVKGGLNFTVAKDGYITAIVGTFFSLGDKHSFFDLYTADRSDKNSVTLTKINKIYKDDDGIYYDDDTKGTEVFCFENITKDCLITNAAYYVEFPVKAGDYVIGVDTGSSENNAYLMYLDIGANGDDDAPTKTLNINNVEFVNDTLGNADFPEHTTITVELTSQSAASFAQYLRTAGTTYTSDGKKIDTHLQYYISNISYKLLPDGYGDEKTSVIF